MRHEVHVYIHSDEATEARLADIRRLLLNLTAKETAMSAQLDALTAAVAHETQVTASAVTLIQGLVDQIRNLPNDAAAIQQLADEVEAQASALGAAVAQNTPAG